MKNVKQFKHHEHMPKIKSENDHDLHIYALYIAVHCQQKASDKMVSGAFHKNCDIEIS